MLGITIKNNITRMKLIVSDVFYNSAKTNTSSRTPKQHKIKKRHWCLGSLVILTGSWITHTTTATIYEDSETDIKLEFALLLNDIDLVNNERIINQAQSKPKLSNTQLIIANEAIKEANLPETPQLTEVKHTIKKGETLGLIFKKLSLDSALPHRISLHQDAQRLVTLSIGKELTFRLDDNAELKEISYPSNSLQEFLVTFTGGLIDDAQIIDLPYKIVQHHVSAEITSSLYEAALDAGLTINLVMEMIRIFGWDIDFAQDIRGSDRFHVIYDDYRLNGEKLADGNILAAEFTTQGNTYRAIRFETEQGDISYYTPEGESMLGTFLRSPVDFSRISSRFGNRKHPILKTWRAHNGVDYAASTGTPIRATADGKVIHAGTKGGYGRTAILRHAGRFTTLYAHMSGFANGIKSGVSVKQGDIIGYVGSTGLATGPHLHYEFQVDGIHKNPLTYKTPKASAIEKSSLAAFESLSGQLFAELDLIAKRYQLAKASSTTSQL